MWATTFVIIFSIIEVICAIDIGDPSKFPNPQRDPASCGRSDASWLCDPDKLINNETQGYFIKKSYC